MVGFFNGATEFVTVDLRGCIHAREMDQFTARRDHVQATHGHQVADGGFAFIKRKELSAEITESPLCFPHVSHSLVVLADLPRTDRRFPWSGERKVSKG
jgi:hypothetical protein